MIITRPGGETIYILRNFMIKVILCKREFKEKNMEPSWWPVKDQSHKRRSYDDDRDTLNDVWYVPKSGYPSMNVYYE